MKNRGLRAPERFFWQERVLAQLRFIFGEVRYEGWSAACK